MGSIMNGAAEVAASGHCITRTILDARSLLVIGYAGGLLRRGNSCRARDKRSYAGAALAQVVDVRRIGYDSTGHPIGSFACDTGLPTQTYQPAEGAIGLSLSVRLLVPLEGR